VGGGGWATLRCAATRIVAGALAGAGAGLGGLARAACSLLLPLLLLPPLVLDGGEPVVWRSRACRRRSDMGGS
jgi:hypothetical protein